MNEEKIKNSFVTGVKSMIQKIKDKAKNSILSDSEKKELFDLENMDKYLSEETEITIGFIKIVIKKYDVAKSTEENIRNITNSEEYQEFKKQKETEKGGNNPENDNEPNTLLGRIKQKQAKEKKSDLNDTKNESKEEGKKSDSATNNGELKATHVELLQKREEQNKKQQGRY